MLDLEYPPLGCHSWSAVKNLGGTAKEQGRQRHWKRQQARPPALADPFALEQSHQGRRILIRIIIGRLFGIAELSMTLELLSRAVLNLPILVFEKYCRVYSHILANY